MEIDLHGLELSEAIIEVYHALAECKMYGDNDLTLIHGYRHGRVLQSYFRSPRFLADTQRKGYTLRAVKSGSPATSKYQIIF